MSGLVVDRMGRTDANRAFVQKVECSVVRRRMKAAASDLASGIVADAVDAVVDAAAEAASAEAILVEDRNTAVRSFVRIEKFGFALGSAVGKTCAGSHWTNRRHRLVLAPKLV